MPRIRCRLDDFEVEEVPLYPPCGEGEHTFLLIEKRGVDTEAVARDLERALRVPRLAIGYAGRKDRWALTRQWMSVPRLEPAAALDLGGRSWSVLEAVRHRHKLRTGDLVANRFRVIVREVSTAAAAAASERLEEMVRRGMPNRFGRQRFGREGDNAAAGAAILRGGRAGRERLRGDRRQARFLVSALQSALFNQVLERRPVPPWQLLDGDLAVVHRSGGLFPVEDAAAEAARAEALEISPTGPIYGTKMREPAGAVRVLEESVWLELGLASWRDLEPPRGLSIDGARRALRVPVAASSLRALDAGPTAAAALGAPAAAPGASSASDAGAIELRFELPAGSYATVLVEELFADEAVEEGPAEGRTAGAGVAESAEADGGGQA